MTIKRTFIIVLSTLAGAVLAILLNVLVVEQLLIPDPCAFHDRESRTAIWKLFYDFPAANGGHPMTSPFNMVLTLLLGGWLGYILSVKKTRLKIS